MSLQKLKTKYARLARTTEGPSRVGWIDALQQAVQFEILLDLDIAPLASILDVGCGTGDLLDVLVHGGFQGAYTGLDLMPSFTADASDRFGTRPDTTFLTGDILSSAVAPHDFVLASGLFDYTTEGDDQTGWEMMLKRLFEWARLALVWNGYYHLPPDRPDMWAVDLSTLVEQCQQLSPYWRLRTDYAPGQYTVFVFKRDYWLTPALQTLIGHLFLDRSLIQRLHQEPQYFTERYGVSLQQLNLLDSLL